MIAGLLSPATIGAEARTEHGARRFDATASFEDSCQIVQAARNL